MASVVAGTVKTTARGKADHHGHFSDWRIELITIPVTDVDRAKAFYVDQVGFHADHDQQVSETLRFVQLTPPGFGVLDRLRRGADRHGRRAASSGLQIVVPSADEALAHLRENGVEAQGVIDLDWGRFVIFPDPDGNAWTLAGAAAALLSRPTGWRRRKR